MDSGYLYFIKDEYYDDFKHKDLKPNKSKDVNGVEHNRPCFYAFEEDGIYWMIPISSQVSKYKTIYNNKTKDGKSCDTIVFGYVKGNENAFLIQNMIPVTSDYVNNIYVDKATNKPIEINEKKKKEVNAKVRKVLRLTRGNIAKIVFTPILEIEKELRKKSLKKVAEAMYNTKVKSINDDANKQIASTRQAVKEHEIEIEKLCEQIEEINKKRNQDLDAVNQEYEVEIKRIDSM